MLWIRFYRYFFAQTCISLLQAEFLGILAMNFRQLLTKSISIQSDPETNCNASCFVGEDMGISNLTEAFVSVQSERECEGIFTELLISPYLEEASALIQNGHVTDFFAHIAGKLALTEKNFFLKRIAASSASRVCFVTNGVAKPVLEHLVNTCSRIFIPTGTQPLLTFKFLHCMTPARLDHTFN